MVLLSAAAPGPSFTNNFGRHRVWFSFDVNVHVSAGLLGSRLPQGATEVPIERSLREGTTVEAAPY
jgi:hypothetical protein